MAQLRRQYEMIRHKGAEVVVVGPDGAAAFEKHWAREKLPFVGLPDPTHTVSDAFGQQFKLLKLGRMPALVIIDEEGTVRVVHYGASMSDIPSTDLLLEWLS